MTDSTQVPPAPAARISTSLKIVLLVVPVLLIYAHTLDSPFYLDDYANIVENPSVRMRAISVEGLSGAGFNTVIGRRPVANVSFALNYYFHRYNLPGYHLVNISIHILNGLALFFLVSSMLRIPGFQWPFDPKGPDGAGPRQTRRGPDEAGAARNSLPLAGMPFFTALIWLVHPLHTQSVTYIVQRMNSLSTLFYIVALLMYLQARLSEKTSHSIILFGATVMSGLLALGSKEIALTLPVVVFLCEWFFFQQLNPRWLKKQIPLILGLVLLVGLVGLIFMGSNPLRYIADTYQTRNFSMGQRVLTEFRVVIHYVTLMVFPHPDRLSLEYNFPISRSLLNPATTLFSLAGLVALVILAIFLARRHRLISFCILGFLCNLVIESSVLGLEIIFEHRTYLPSIFAAILFSLIMYKYVPSRLLRVMIFCLLAVVYSRWTYERNALWRDEIGFLTYTAAKAPFNWRVHSNLGNALAARERYAEALAHYKKALAFSPYDTVPGKKETVEQQIPDPSADASRRFHADLFSNMGNALVRQGGPAEAVRFLTRALAWDPRHVKAHTSMGLALVGLGKPDEAIRHYQLALQTDPGFIEAHNNLGLALAARGEVSEAIASFNRAIALQPTFAEAHNNLGVQLASQNELPEAISSFSKAVTLRPEYAQAHYNLGMALYSLGNNKAAGASFQQSLALKPDFLPARKGYAAVVAREQSSANELKRLRDDVAFDPKNPDLRGKLGDFYKKNGNMPAAIAQYEKVNEMVPDHIPAMNNLALACAVTGDYGRALVLFKRIADLQPHNADPCYKIASVYARQGDAEKAVNWLEKAIERGYSDWNTILADRNLKAIGNTAAFVKLKGKYHRGP